MERSAGKQARRLQIAAWSLAGLVAALAVFVWGQSINWRLSLVNVYLFFPLLGLLAFSIMWSHYVSGVLRQYWGLPDSVLKSYFEITSYVVLVLIVLHPGLLALQRYLDGHGLPPGSYESYVAPGLGWITILGLACLTVFLLFELRRIYGDRRWWRFVLIANDAAMLGIFYHALRLGSQLVIGWYRGIWFFYGIVLTAILIAKYWPKRTAEK